MQARRSGAEPEHQQLQDLADLYAAGRLELLVTKARALLRQFPKDVVTYNILGAALVRLEKIDEAVGVYREIIKLHPTYAEAHNNLGVALGRLYDFEGAAASYHEALRVQPHYIDAAVNLGHALQRLGRLDEALASCQHAVNLGPAIAVAHNYMGGVLRDLGRPTEAAASYRRALALDPASAENHADLGSALLDMGKLAEAAACYRDALRRDPGFADAHHRLGDVLADLGEFKDAALHYGKAAHRESCAKMLSCFFAAGRHEDYATALGDLARSDPTNIRAATISASVTQQTGAANIYPFCAAPLRFVAIHNIADQIAPIEIFDADVVAELRGPKFVFEPPGKTTKGGHQTSGNLFELGGTRINALQNIIRTQIAAYVAAHASADDLFIRRWPRAYHLNGWYVNLRQGGHQQMHIHPSGWLSGVLYLRVPTQLDGDEGAIRFTITGEDDRGPERELLHRPRAGDLVLFPSSLLHHTIPFAADEERHSLSFDLCPKE